MRIQVCVLVALTGCMAGAPGDDGAASETADADASGDLVRPVAAHALVSGVNGTACTASPYNCKLRATGGQRVTTAGGDDSWGIALGASVRDEAGTMRFLYGYVPASDGTKRFGWIAQDALDVSSGCS